MENNVVYKVIIEEINENELAINLKSLPCDVIKLMLDLVARYDNDNQAMIIQKKYYSDIKIRLESHAVPYESLFESNSAQSESEYTPKPHQERTIEKCLSQKKVINSSDMGLGKTSSSIWAAEKIQGEVLVIAPRSLLYNWEQEIYKFAPKQRAQILSLNSPRELEMVKYNICTYEYATKYTKELNDIGFSVLIADECQKIRAVKNTGEPGSNRSAAVITLASSIEYVFLLSGTIVPNHIKDLYNSFVCVGATEITFNENFFQFGLRYCNGHKFYVGSTTHWDFNGESNLEELYFKMQPYMIRYRKSDVLPDINKIRQAIPIRINSPSCVEYDVANPTSILGQFVREKQRISLEKIPYTIDFVQDLIEANHKVVVFCNYLDSVHKVKDYFGERCVMVTGEMSAKQQNEEVNNFRKNENVSIIVMTIQIGSIGLNLVEADTVVFNDLSFLHSDHLQAEDRVARIGQQSEICQIYYIYAYNDRMDYHAAKLQMSKFEAATKAVDADANTDSFDITKEMIKLYKEELG